MPLNILRPFCLTTRKSLFLSMSVNTLFTPLPFLGDFYLSQIIILFSPCYNHIVDLRLFNDLSTLTYFSYLFTIKCLTIVHFLLSTDVVFSIFADKQYHNRVQKSILVLNHKYKTRKRIFNSYLYL